ncbi:MAG: tetratricopeptide repeat protein [Candidatus Omnitrophica bacterium]|nr:tetratricopeptide repeat protein [Candidatus Omnitrophota bacterium]
MRTAPDTPLSQAAKYFLADCYKQLGEFDKALAAYTELISQEQESFWVEQALHDKTELEEVLADFRGQ